MKHFHICCDGSFGNRLSGLIGGLTLSRICSLSPKVSWPSTNMCRALFGDIFSNTDIEYTSNSIRDYYSSADQYNLISNYSEYLKFFHTARTDPEYLNIDSFLKLIESSDKPVFYYTPLLYDWIPKNEIINTLNQVSYVKFIQDQVNHFILSNFNNAEYYGMHIRMTDFVYVESFDVDSLYEFAKESKDKNFFVCSDEKQIENKFSQLNNAFSYPKREYTTKLDPSKDWQSPYTDEDGRYSVFNVERSKISVIDAIIDFLILSKSNIIKTGNHSTFLKMAMIVGDTIK
jgi:hypothetical protein